MSRKGSVKEDECGVCDRGVERNEQGMQCELCDKWWHAGCVKIPESVYKVLGKLSSLHWFCEGCNSGARRMFVTLTKLNEKVDQLQLELESKANKVECSKLNDKVKKCEDRVKKCEDSIEQIDDSFRKLVEAKLTTEVEKKVESFKDIVEQQLRDEMRGDIGDTLRKEFMTPMNDDYVGFNKKIDDSNQRLDDLLTANAELEDIETRRNNIILYRVEESQKVLATERNAEDIRTCEQFLTALQVGVDQGDIRKVVRLGRRDNENATSRSRPILVLLGSRHAKNLIMESLFKIKSLNEKFRQITVAHDLTKKQREECKKLVAQARERSAASGDSVYKVRGPPGQWRIVPIKRN